MSNRLISYGKLNHVGKAHIIPHTFMKFSKLQILELAWPMLNNISTHAYR